MPNISSYADVIRDWELLLTAAGDNADLLANVERHRTALEKHLTETKALKGRQDSAAAERQASTQALNAKLEEGRELATRFRSSVKAEIGPKSERLVQFKVAPQRKRGRRADKPPEVKPPDAVAKPEVSPSSAS